MPTQIVAAAFGGPEVLAVVHDAVPAPRPGQVTVAVRAAGLNPVDYKKYSGAMGADASVLPLPVGAEVSGVITAVGPGARCRAGAVGVGDEVIVHPMVGAYADEVTVEASAITPKPASMPFQDAAGLMLTGTTAIHALAAAGVIGGTTVLIHAVSGGVGLSAAQVAVADGATVVGTASHGHHEGLLERVLRVAPGGIDTAIDCAGTDEAVNVSLALVDSPRQVVTIAAWHRLADGITGIGGRPGTDVGTEIRDAARLRLTALVEDDALEVIVAKTYPLTQAGEATELLMGGHAGGKIVLIPQPRCQFQESSAADVRSGLQHHATAPIPLQTTLGDDTRLTATGTSCSRGVSVDKRPRACSARSCCSAPSTTSTRSYRGVTETRRYRW